MKLKRRRRENSWVKDGDLENTGTPWNKITPIPKGALKKKKRAKGAEDLFGEVIAENVPNLGEETDIQIQEAQKTPIKINKNRPTPRHIVIKFARCPN